MFCNKCGTENKDNSLFCRKCGNKLSQSVEDNNTENIKNAKKTPINRNCDNRTKIAALIIAAVAIGVIIAVFLVYLQKAKKNAETKTSMSASENPAAAKAEFQKDKQEEPEKKESTDKQTKKADNTEKIIESEINEDEEEAEKDGVIDEINSDLLIGLWIEPKGGYSVLAFHGEDLYSYAGNGEYCEDDYNYTGNTLDLYYNAEGTTGDEPMWLSYEMKAERKNGLTWLWVGNGSVSEESDPLCMQKTGGRWFCKVEKTDDHHSDEIWREWEAVNSSDLDEYWEECWNEYLETDDEEMLLDRLHTGDDESDHLHIPQLSEYNLGVTYIGFGRIPDGHFYGMADDRNKLKWIDIVHAWYGDYVGETYVPNEYFVPCELDEEKKKIILYLSPQEEVHMNYAIDSSEESTVFNCEGTSGIFY